MSDAPNNPKLTTVSEMEADHQDLEKLRSNVADCNNAVLDARNAEADKDYSHARSKAISSGLLTTGETVKEEAAKAEVNAVRAIATKNGKDAEATWSVTRSALASVRPDKPYVAAARATEAAAISASAAPSKGLSK